MSESEHDYDIKFLPEAMIAALGMALGARDQKSKLPVIRAVHIYTKGGRLWVASTNLEHFYRAPIGCKVDTDLDCVVDYPDGLQAMLKLFVNGKLSFPVEMKLNKRTMLLTVRMHKTVATFKCTDPQEFPLFPVAYVEDEDKTEPLFYKGPAGSASYGYALPPTFKNALAQPPHPGKKMTDLQRQNAIVALACERKDDFDMDALVDGLDPNYNWPRCLMDWRYRDADKQDVKLNGEPYEIWPYELNWRYKDEPVQGCDPDPAIWRSVILTHYPGQAWVRPFVSYYRIDGTGWQPEPEPEPTSAPAPGIVVGTKRASHKASKKAFLNSFSKLAQAVVKPTPATAPVLGDLERAVDAAKGKVFQNAVAALPEADYNEVLDAIDNVIEATDQAERSTIERLAPVIVYQAPARPKVNPKAYVVGQPCPFCGSEFKAVIEKGNRDRAVFTACTHGVYVESQKERA